MRKINNIKIYYNNNKKSSEVYKKLVRLLKKNKFNIVEEKFDLAIAIGGDGSMLRLIKETNYNKRALYVGINSGTLGFLQEVDIEDINTFVNNLNTNSFDIKKLAIQETIIKTKDSTTKFESINEIIIRDKDLNTAFLNIKMGSDLLENFVGDGILVSTTTGSTAYNLSFGGAIVHDKIHTLQITPIAPLNNKTYRNLLNSIIIPHRRAIYITPFNRTSDVILSVDGENHIFDDVISIKTCVNKKQLRFLRFEDYNFLSKINDKFISNND